MTPFWWNCGPAAAARAPCASKMPTPPWTGPLLMALASSISPPWVAIPPRTDGCLAANGLHRSGGIPAAPVQKHSHSTGLFKQYSPRSVPAGSLCLKRSASNPLFPGYSGLFRCFQTYPSPSWRNSPAGRREDSCARSNAKRPAREVFFGAALRASWPEGRQRRKQDSAVPPGLHLFWNTKPAVETAGYCQPRLRRWSRPVLRLMRTARKGLRQSTA